MKTVFSTALAAVATITLAGALITGAAPAEAGAVSAALGTPFMDDCIACESCPSQPGHQAVGVGDWYKATHGNHAKCSGDDGCTAEHGPSACEEEPLPVAAIEDIFEGARLAALSTTPAEFLDLQADYPSYVSFNRDRASVQVRTCRKSINVSANFPVAWSGELPLEGSQ